MAAFPPREHGCAHSASAHEHTTIVAHLDGIQRACTACATGVPLAADEAFFVCLKCFRAVCSAHVAQHHADAGHPLFVRFGPGCEVAGPEQGGNTHTMVTQATMRTDPSNAATSVVCAACPASLPDGIATQAVDGVVCRVTGHANTGVDRWRRYSHLFAGQGMTWVVAFICFGYYYKALLHLLQVPGYPDKDPPLIKGTDYNHWLELLIYCPVYWFCMHLMVSKVFQVPLPGETSVEDLKRRQRWQLLAEFFVAYQFFGMGVHGSANNVELYSRVSLKLDGTPVHDVIWFYDEELSHFLQFIPFFGTFFMVTVHDAPGRFTAPIWSVIMGAGHGVERAIGIIEGDSAWMAVPATCVMLLSAYLRWKWRYEGDIRAVWKDFFFRHLSMKAVTMCSAVLAWHFVFGLKKQSSELPMWQVGLFGILSTVIAIVAMFAWDYYRDNYVYAEEEEPAPGIGAINAPKDAELGPIQY